MNGRLWTLSLSIAMSLGVFLNYFKRLEHCFLTNFHDRPIGVGVLAGSDALERTWAYIITMIVFMTICTVTHAGLTGFRAFIRRSIRPIHIRVEESVLATLSSFTVSTLLFSLFTASEFLANISKILFAFIGLTFLFIFLKIRSFKGKGIFLRCYRDSTVFFFGLTLVGGLFLAGSVLLDRRFIFALRHVAAFFILVTGFMMIYPKLLSQWALDARKVGAALTMAGMPIALIPLSIPLSNELQFTLSGRWDLSPRILALIVIGLLALLSLILFTVSFRRSRVLWKPARIVGYFYFPAFLAGIYLFKVHKQVAIFFGKFDLNHQAEATVPIQQFFSFGAVPFVDILPTHGLSDIFAPLLYSLANGYRGLEMLLWSWLVGLAALLLLYLLIARITTPLFSLGVMLLLPVEMIFQSYYAMFLLPCLLLFWVMKKPGVFRYVLLWISVAWVFAWRSDFGMAAIVSCLFVTPGILAYHKPRVPNWSWVRALTIPIGTLCAVCGLAVFLFVIISSLRGRSPFEVLNQFLHFGKDMLQTHARVGIFRGFSTMVGWQYIGVPLVSMAYMIHFARRIYLKATPPSRAQVILVCLAAFSLILSVRGLQRHSLLRGYNPYLVTFLLCLAPWYFSSVNRRFAELGFLAVSLLCFLVFSSGFRLSEESFYRLRQDGMPTTLLEKLRQTRFTFNRQAAHELRRAGMPKEVVARLAFIEEVPIDFEENFLKTVSALLADKNGEQYQRLMLRHAQKRVIYPSYRTEGQLLEALEKALGAEPTRAYRQALVSQAQFPIGLSLLVESDHPFAFRYWKNKPDRVLITDRTQYAHLNDFFRTSMGKQQSFLDFASAPMLYFFTDRQCYAYFHQIIAYTTDSTQRYLLKNLSRYHSKNRLPFVIFKQGNWWDGIDGVPQELRSYRIAEFIYRHFQPYVLVDNYEVWREKNLVAGQSIGRFIPLRRHNHGRFRHHDLKVSGSTGKQFVVRTGNSDPFIWNAFDLQAGIPLSVHRRYWLRVSYTSSIAGRLKVHYAFDHHSFNGDNSRAVSVDSNRNIATCWVEIPTMAANLRLREIRFDPPGNAVFTIDRVEVAEIKDGVIPIDERPAQQFDLKQLPYLWGRYDDQDAARTTPVLETVALPGENVTPHQPIDCAISSGIDKTSGNYLHFKIRSSREGIITVRYGKEMANRLTFELVPSPKEIDYLVRISTQWAWMSQPVSLLRIETTAPTRITGLFIRKGD